MRDPGKSKGYFSLISFGCAWSLELRTFMALAVAEKMNITPRHLPPMRDDQLWESFKAAVGTGYDISLKPDVFNAFPLATHSLSLGEAIAITIGRYFNTARLPHGVCVADLISDAGLDDSDLEVGLTATLCTAVVKQTFARLEHPATLDWRIRQQRYPSSIENRNCTPILS